MTTIKQKIQAGHAITSAQVKDRQKTIPYRPEYNKIAGSPAAALLLNQIAYWFEKSGNKPFYKFRAPCKDDRYRAGDSWTEELGFTPSMFDTARRNLGAKVTKGCKKSELLNQNIMIYWTDSSRLTWYQLNRDLFDLYVYLAYNEPEILGNLETPIYLDKFGSPYCLDKFGSRNPLYSVTNAVTTTEKAAAKNPPAPPPEIINPEAQSFHSGEEKEPPQPHLLPPEQQALLLFPGEEKEPATPKAEAQWSGSVEQSSDVILSFCPGEKKNTTVQLIKQRQTTESMPTGKSEPTIAQILGQPEWTDEPKEYGDPIAGAMDAARKREDKLDYVYLEAIKAFCELSPYFDYEVVKKDAAMLRNWNSSKAFGGHAKVHGLSPNELAAGIRNISPKEYDWEIKNVWKRGPYGDSLGQVAAILRHVVEPEPERIRGFIQ